jgi:hypothetical protein
MKIRYHIALLILIISCGQGPKKEKEPGIEIQGAVEIIESVVDSVPARAHLDFAEVIANTQTKKLPHIEATNFDSFIDEDDYDEVDAKALKLDLIYPDFNSESHNYRAINSYTIPVNTNFHTIVITLLKGEHEMETILINYNADGEIIANNIVAYDEIAEGMSRTVSRISENKITVNRIFWGNTKEVEEIEYEILYDGTIEKIQARRLDQTIANFSLVDEILKDLQLDWIQTKTDLIATKVYPENPEETIMVIPEIVDEGTQYFTLNSHIVIANNNTNNIKNNYFESNKTNEWVSDAIELDGIQIDSTSYRISEDKTAFGVNVSHFGHSRVNPYSNKALSLFVKSGDSLVKILSDYTLENYGGEWDGDCDGEFIDEEKVPALTTKKTNGHFDILVNTKITNTKSFEDKNDECQTETTVNFNNSLLKFDGQNYTKTKANTISYAEFDPKKLQQIDIDNFSVDNAYQWGGFKFIIGNDVLTARESKLAYAKKDWGDRLLMLGASNNLVFKSKGFGDLYLFEPHFYKSEASDKVIIICQMAFEYPFGGEVFILENKTLKPIGTLDIEPYDENLDTYLTDVVEISELEGSIVFSLKSEEVVLKPGSEDEVKTNKNAIYVYQNNELKLKTN